MAQTESKKLRWYSFRGGVLFWIVVIALYFLYFDAINNWAVSVFGR
jgi:hypothetical protein